MRSALFNAFDLKISIIIFFDYNPDIADFYLTNPIARSSAVMAECSALAEGRTLSAAE